MRGVIKKDLLGTIDQRPGNRTNRFRQMSLRIGINVAHAPEDDPLNRFLTGVSWKVSPL